MTAWTIAHQAPLSLGFSRQEYWSGLSFPSPGDLSDPGSEPRSPALQAVSCITGEFFSDWATTEALLGPGLCMLCRFSRVQLFVTPWTVAHQVPLSMGFSRQEYWSGLPFPTPVDLPNSGIEPASPVSPPLAGGFFTTMPPRKWQGGLSALKPLSAWRVFIS